MKKGKNNGIFYMVALVILIIVGLYLKDHRSAGPVPFVDETKEEVNTEEVNEISITTETIKEKNFSGTMPKISGSSLLATTAKTYIEKTIAGFKKEADADVPDMREKFGADSPISNYTIDITASEVKSTDTHSIVISEYTYTGGANGNSTYKVITASNTSGEILTLADIIKKDKQAAFVSFVKKVLNAWRPEGSSAPVVFPDEVKNLTFNSFTNWSLDDKNLIIYFDKYQIGPGVLGPVAFPIALSKIKDFLQ